MVEDPKYIITESESDRINRKKGFCCIRYSISPTKLGNDIFYRSVRRVPASAARKQLLCESNVVRKVSDHVCSIASIVDSDSFQHPSSFVLHALLGILSHSHCAWIASYCILIKRRWRKPDLRYV
jgi:hypothetical protein